MTKPGDRVELPGRRVGQAPRLGTVEDVQGSLITVRWDSGETTTFTPQAGSLTVLTDRLQRR